MSNEDNYEINVSSDKKMMQGMDWFAFQTQIRKLVMEMIEPSVKRSYEAFEASTQVQQNLDRLRRKIEDYEQHTIKQFNRVVQQDQFLLRMQEMEKGRQKEDEKLWTELHKHTTQIEIAKEKGNQCMAQCHLFTKISENSSREAQTVIMALESIKTELHEQIIKSYTELSQEVLLFGKEQVDIDGRLKSCKRLIEGHNDFMLNLQVAQCQLKQDQANKEQELLDELQKKALNIQKDYEQRLQKMKEDLETEFRMSDQHVKHEILNKVGFNQEESENEHEERLPPQVLAPKKYQPPSRVYLSQKMEKRLLRRHKSLVGSLEADEVLIFAPREEDRSLKEGKAKENLFMTKETSEIFQKDVEKEKSEPGEEKDEIRIQLGEKEMEEVKVVEIKKAESKEIKEVEVKEESKKRQERQEMIVIEKIQLLDAKEDKIEIKSPFRAKETSPRKVPEEYWDRSPRKVKDQQSFLLASPYTQRESQRPTTQMKLQVEKKQVFSMEQIWAFVHEQLQNNAYLRQNNLDMAIALLREDLETQQLQLQNQMDTDIQQIEMAMNQERQKAQQEKMETLKTIEKRISVQSSGEQQKLSPKTSDRKFKKQEETGVIQSMDYEQIWSGIENRVKNLYLTMHRRQSMKQERQPQMKGKSDMQVSSFPFEADLIKSQVLELRKDLDSQIENLRSLIQQKPVARKSGKKDEVKENFKEPTTREETYFKSLNQIEQESNIAIKEYIKAEVKKEVGKEVEIFESGGKKEDGAGMKLAERRLEELESEIEKKLVEVKDENEQSIRVKVLEIRTEFLSQFSAQQESFDQQLSSSNQKLIDMIKRYKSPQPQANAEPAEPSNSLHPGDVEIMLVEAKSDLLKDLQEEFKRLQTKVETNLLREVNEKLKEQMEFWQDATKKQLHHEVGQLGKEQKIKVNKLEKQVDDIEKITEQLTSDLRSTTRSIERQLEDLREQLLTIEHQLEESEVLDGESSPQEKAQKQPPKIERPQSKQKTIEVKEKAEHRPRGETRVDNLEILKTLEEQGKQLKELSQKMSMRESVSNDELSKRLFEFEAKLKVYEQLIEEKLQYMEKIESELERGIKRNARDKTDFMLQTKQVTEKTEKDIKAIRAKVEELEFLVKNSLDHSDMQLQEDSVMAANNMDPANDYEDSARVTKEEEAGEKKISNSKRIKVIERNMNQIKAYGFLPDVKFNQSLDKSVDHKVSKKLSNTDLVAQDYLTSNFQAMAPGNTSRMSKGKGQIQDKTMNLLKQTTYHNYSQILDAHAELKSNLQSKREEGRQYVQSEQSVIQIKKNPLPNPNKINWENAKLKETHKLMAFQHQQQHYTSQPKYRTNSNEITPIRLHALVSNHPGPQLHTLAQKSMAQTNRLHEKRASSHIN